MLFLKELLHKKPTADNIADSTRISTTKVHRGNRKRNTLTEADYGYTWSGYHFGFKLRIIINSLGEIMCRGMSEPIW